MSKGVVLLIDADLVAYRSAAVCEKRSVNVIHKVSGREREFETRTQFKEFLKAKDYAYDAAAYEFQDLQEASPAAHALQVIKSQISAFEEKMQPVITRIILSGSGNFRSSLPLPKKYKGDRTKSIRPLLLGACQDYLRHCKGAEVVDGAEADDAVIYLGYKYLEQGYDPIISSIDKDAMAYSGLRVWNFADLESSPVLIPQLGYLEKTAQGVKGAGFLWYCHQMLLGDATDHYRPFEACGQKLGEISCYNLLKDCKDEKQALQIVVAKYREFIGDKFSYTDWQGVERKVNYIDWLCLYHQCVRMKETPDDPLDFKQFLIKHGVPL